MYDEELDSRAENAIDWADSLSFTHVVKGSGKTEFLEVSPSGRRWLTLSPEEQYLLSIPTSPAFRHASLILLRR